ncbi:MAG: VanW family protein, partial [Candidatus Heimdallarchaeota archaeon]|nr:VanW family protein [Candidatus Heimdallarchaeota archaeon]
MNLFDCDEEYFNPDEILSQKDFLNWFFKLKYYKKPTLLKKQYPLLSNDHLRSWLEARRLNLLSNNIITYKVFQDFLYRNTVVEANLGQSFREGMMIDYKEVTAGNYHNLSEISLIQKNLQEIVDRLSSKKKLTSEEAVYKTKTKRNLKAFGKLKTSLEERPFVLRQRPDLNPEVSRAVREYSLQDVLYRYSYDYSHNEAYRKHNLTTGVLKMDGKVFMPGDVLDYWKIISDKNLWDFRYGWVIAEGESKWMFGGGICGSSSMVFLPAWKAGLEIIERNNHSQYFSDLYPMEDIGLDATIYRPRPNLRIKNNTDSP